MRFTKKIAKKKIKISRNATPGSTIRSCIKFFDGKVYYDCAWEIGLDEDKVYTSLEKWGWIEDRGLFILTKDGFNELNYI
jgi:hypothetical protein